MTAISAVDLAIWDAKGKILKQPVFKLLGGRTKSKIPVYASRLYSQPLDTLYTEAKAYAEQGFKSVKLRFGWGPKDGIEGMRKNVDLVRTTREAVGDNVDIMADCYMGWNVEYAKRMLRMLTPFDMRWVEEPVMSDDLHGYAELTRTQPRQHLRRRARIHAGRLPRCARSQGLRHRPARRQPRRRHHRGQEDRRPLRGERHSVHPACRADAQLPRHHVELRRADLGILPESAGRSRQRAVLVHLRRRAGGQGRLHRSRRHEARLRPDAEDRRTPTSS